MESHPQSRSFRVLQAITDSIDDNNGQYNHLFIRLSNEKPVIAASLPCSYYALLFPEMS